MLLLQLGYEHVHRVIVTHACGPPGVAVHMIHPQSSHGVIQTNGAQGFQDRARARECYLILPAHCHGIQRAQDEANHRQCNGGSQEARKQDLNCNHTLGLINSQVEGWRPASLDSLGYAF